METYLPELEVCVWILDDGSEAVGVQCLEKVLLLQVLGRVDLRLVRDGELFKDQSDFPRVGPNWAGVSVYIFRRGKIDSSWILHEDGG